MPGDALHRAERLEAIGRELLTLIGEDPEREGLRDTPARWARWWMEFANYTDTNTGTAFDAIQTDQLIVLRGVRVWTLCEHHLLPFYCDLTLAYLPVERVLGLSKLARIAHLHAHRLQMQERLVTDIADHIEREARTEHVAVLAEGEHLCMTMRGIRTEGTMASSCLRGAFRDSPTLRQEFFAVAYNSNRGRR